MFEDPENKIDNIKALVTEPEVIENVETAEAVQKSTSNEENVQKSGQESPQARNFRELRERMQRAERERDEALKLAEQIKNAQMDSEFEVSPEDFAQGKHLSKLQKEIRSLKQEIQTYHQQSTETSIESRIKSQYKDFDQVVTTENLQQLTKVYPELAQTLSTSNDLYSKGVSAYTLIKKLGIVPQDYSQQQELVKNNYNKPRPTSSVGVQSGSNPLNHANAFSGGLTEELKNILFKEMVAAKKDY